jgi:ribose transport system permease protein
VVWLVFGFLVAQIAFKSLAFGWRVMATGSNRASARALGINTNRVRVGVMVISSCTAALAGMIYAGEVQGAVYTLGSSDLLTVLAGVVSAARACSAVRAACWARSWARFS